MTTGSANLLAYFISFCQIISVVDYWFCAHALDKHTYIPEGPAGRLLDRHEKLHSQKLANRRDSAFCVPVTDGY